MPRAAVLLVSVLATLLSALALDQSSAADPKQTQLECPRGAHRTKSHCVCDPAFPVCAGEGCVRGRIKRTGQAVYGFPIACALCTCSQVRQL